VAAVPKACPICDASQPFEHVRGGLLCPVCFFAFRVNDKLELVEWWPTQNSTRVVRR
jgi:hypothetical protein